MQSKAVKVVEGGKLIIPASFRREMGIGIGDTVVVELADGELRVRSRKVDIRRIQERVRQLGTIVALNPDQAGTGEHERDAEITLDA